MSLDIRLDAMRAELDGAVSRDTFWAKLKARIAILEEDRAVLDLSPAASRCNLAGVVHGGESAAMLDQACGLAANATAEGRWVTGKAELVYRAPVPGQTVIICEARVTHRTGRQARVEGIVQAVDDDTALVTARMTFIRLREQN
ncbi:PaaI family thioesterase [Oceanicaulis sp.]|uniref:PaaI family thioesterase n=1 Tax=Oceanicaulis sp. TaxID=1924941 RepID=UPI003D2DB6AD